MVSSRLSRTRARDCQAWDSVAPESRSVWSRRSQGLAFAVAGRAGEAELEGAGEAGVVGLGFLDQTCGESLGEFDIGAVVEQGEGLERDCFRHRLRVLWGSPK
jgi:hypothetical protein